MTPDRIISLLRWKRIAGLEPASPATSRTLRFPRRLLLLAGLALALLVLGPLAFGWLRYRNSNIVTHDAFVSGLVTQVGARIDGQVKAVVVVPNQRVHAGDVLVRLEDSHLLPKADQARAELERATRELEIERQAIGQSRQLLQTKVQEAADGRDVALARLSEARSDLEHWTRQRDRIADLSARGLVPTSVMEDTQAKYEAAVAAAHAAEAGLGGASTGQRYARIELQGLSVRESRLALLQSEVDKARAVLAAATAEVEATVIRAPEDGWVVDLLAGPGTSVRVGQPMLTFWGEKQVWVEAWVDQKNVRDIQIGNAVDVSLDAFPDRHLTGEVEAMWAGNENEQKRLKENANLSPLLARDSRINVRIALRGLTTPLLPGLSAVVGIHKHARAAAPANSAANGRSAMTALAETSPSLADAVRRARGNGRGPYTPATAEEQARAREWLENRLRTGAADPGPWFAERRLDRDGVTLFTAAPGRGVYVYREQEPAEIIVEAPHSFTDLYTLDVALELFAQPGAEALLVNSTRRDYGCGPGEDPCPADVAHVPNSLFEAAHEAFHAHDPEATVVQLHGFSEQPGDPLVILSAARTRTNLQPYADALRRVLKAGPGAVGVYPEDNDRLGGTTSVQARYLAHVGGKMLHVEIARALRQRLRDDGALRAAFAAAFVTGTTPAHAATWGGLKAQYRGGRKDE